jgi:hypothetical protein
MTRFGLFVATLLVAFSGMRLARADDDIIGRYSGTWKSTTREKGAVVLIVQNDAADRVGGNRGQRYDAVLKLKDTSDEFFGAAVEVTLEKAPDGSWYLSGSYEEQPPGKRRFSLSSEERNFRLTGLGLEGGRVRMSYMPGPGVRETSVTLTMEFEKE